MQTLLKLLFLLLLISPLKAEFCDTSNVVFGITNAEIKYLRYWHFHNKFDSADVHYTFGEIRIVGTNGTERVSIMPRKDEYYAVQGDSVNGIDNILMDIARTEKFKYGANSKIEFFRHISATIPCDAAFPPNPNNDGWGGQASHWPDYLWVVGKNKVADLSEFVVEVVDANDENKHIAIDSVGVDRNPNSVLAQRYGTVPDKINHIRNLPNSFAGRDVYLRIKPKRIGTTPYGMMMKVIPSWISRSTLMEYDSIKSKKDCSDEVFESLINSYFNRLMVYCDSIRVKTGHLPINLPDIDVLTDGQRQLYYQIFFEKVFMNGDTILAEKPMPNGGVASVADRNGIDFKVQRIIPQPVTQNLTLIVDTKKKINNLNIELYSPDGKKINNLWSGSINKGRAKINIENINLAPGVYLLHFLSADKQIAVYSFVKQ